VPHLWLTILLFLPQIATAQLRSNPKIAALPSYKTKYYIIRTDVTGDDLREAQLRMTKMADEYLFRTRDFSGAVRGQFPFYLFKDEGDYFAAGGVRGSAGAFIPSNRTLMAIAGDPLSPALWHVVQHEGFHQFAANVIGQLPTWIDEGLAEYFGEAIFTGDGFVIGDVPDWRLRRIKKTIDQDGFRSFRDIMLMSLREWNEGLSISNYDQAWTMVHFLVHADGGKYQHAFSAFIGAIDAHQQWEKAWRQHLGDPLDFERRWKKYWRDLPEEASSDVRNKATTQMLTSILARYAAEKKNVEGFDAFFASVSKGVSFEDRHWLPASLAKQAAADAAKKIGQGVAFQFLRGSGALPSIECVPKKGTKWVGRFKLKGADIAEVVVDGK
jgi:hypothetical protein